MEISLILAVADNGVIGKKGKLLPWHQRADIQRFRQITLGHPIIMGRTTFELFDRPLPGRQSIIVTHDPNYQAPDCAVTHSIEEALQAAAKIETDEIFVIGGGAIFAQTLPLASRIYLTRIHAAPEGEVFFQYDPQQWKEVSSEAHAADEQNQYDYTFKVLTRSETVSL